MLNAQAIMNTDLCIKVKQEEIMKNHCASKEATLQGKLKVLTDEVRNRFLACSFVKHSCDSCEKLQEDACNSHAMGNKQVHPASIDGATDFLIDSHNDKTKNKQAKKLIKAEEQQ